MCTRACPCSSFCSSVEVALPAAPICPPRLLKLTVEVGWHLHNVHATGTRRQGGEGRVGQSCTSMPCGSPTGSETGGAGQRELYIQRMLHFPGARNSFILERYLATCVCSVCNKAIVYLYYIMSLRTLSKLSSLYCALVWLLWSPELNMAASNSLPAQTTQPASINHPLYTSNVALFINSGPDSVGYKQCHTGIKCT